MKWITRERPKVDRIACPWLIKNFVDEGAEFVFVPKDKVLETADRMNGIAYDIPGTEYTHYGGECTFDYILKKHNLQEDQALQTLASIVRGADTDRFDLAPEAAGLWAISAGLSCHFKNDQEQLQAGMVIYDALYSWAKYARNEKHTWQSAT